MILPILLLFFNGAIPSIWTILYSFYSLVRLWHHSDTTNIILFVRLWPLLAIKFNTLTYEHVPTSFLVTSFISTSLFIQIWSIYFTLGFEHFVAQGEFSCLEWRLCELLYSLSLRSKSETVFARLVWEVQHYNFITMCFIGIIHWDWLSILWCQLIN